jgi:cell fate regulator YaaT (PSP1 superfamily)
MSSTTQQVMEKEPDRPKIVMLRAEGFQGFFCADSNNIEMKKGDFCVFNVYGEEIFAEVAESPKEIPFSCNYQSIRRVLRLASQKEVETIKNSTQIEGDAMKFCLERVRARDLKMKMVKVKNNLKDHKIIFYYTAESRVDFRELVKDLAARFRTRIEMRQIGVRDEAKLLTGCGTCGRHFCCSGFLDNFAPISIRMAKQQNVNLNPAKISGICGRLLCCLGFEPNNNVEDYQRKNGEIENQNEIINSEQDNDEKNQESSMPDETD